MNNLIILLGYSFYIGNIKNMIKFFEFYRNPVEKGSGNVGARYLLQDMMRTKMIALDKLNAIGLKVYKSNEDYFFHFKIGSESYKKIKYDVLFRLIPNNDEEKNERDINNYELKLISNIPAFAFTYLYVFNDEESSIKELHDKFDKIFFTKKPETRNPHEIKGFEKSIHIALNYIKVNKLDFKYNIDNILEKEKDLKKVFKLINEDFLSLNTILYQYNIEKSLKVEKNKKTKVVKKEKPKKKTVTSSHIPFKSVIKPKIK